MATLALASKQNFKWIQAQKHALFHSFHAWGYIIQIALTLSYFANPFAICLNLIKDMIRREYKVQTLTDFSINTS
jgi:hypothetical protein